MAQTPFPSFPIRDYTVNLDLKPGSYEQATVYPNKYCYYVKELNNGDDLVIWDNNCDTFGERISVLRGNRLLFSASFKDLEEKTQGNLNLLIKRTIEEKGIKILPNKINFL